MNERDTFSNSEIKMPNYRVDNSREKVTNFADYKRKQNEGVIESKRSDNEQGNSQNSEQNIGLSKTKIININDFIFRQYLEFYPELHGLSCKDNTLYLEENGSVLASETLTFDLRTLPGEAWNVNAKTFMEIIKINKSCKSLESFINLLNQNAFNNIVIDKETLDAKITNYMNLYFSIKDSFSYLIEDNKILVGNIETLIATLPKETVVGSLVNEKLDEYFEITKEIGDSKGKGMVLELKNKNVPAIIPENETRARSSKAAFINIAIIIYSVLNIGIILAIAIMK